MKKRLFIYTSIALAAISCNKFEEINTDAFGVTPEMGKMDGATIGGKITANSFAGEVNGIKTQGGFFGENAQEMGGLFTNEADQSRGAFGGIKQ